LNHWHTSFMRILIATSHRAILGGIETYLRALLPELVGKGHEVALFHETEAAPDQRNIDDGVPGLPRWGLEDSEALQKASAWLPDVCFVQGLASPDVEESLVKRFSSVLFAHNYHGTCISGTKRHAFPSPKPCGRAFGPACLALYFPCRCGGLNPLTMLRRYGMQGRRRNLLLCYRAVLVASRHMVLEYEKHGVARERLHMVPLFPPEIAPDPEPPRSRPLTDRILFVSRLTDLKGGLFLVGALATARQALGRPIKLVVAGDGPQRAALERMASRLCLPAEFHGWVELGKRVALMRGSDLLAVPSVWPEPFGLVGVEAGCVGLPAVGFAAGGIPDWLVPGDSGELADGNPPSVAKLAEALVRALADPVYLGALRAGAWRMAQRFTLERHLASLELVLASNAAHIQEVCQNGAR
jgi:glycosyltransferase involved in cell wall biosynthesis